MRGLDSEKFAGLQENTSNIRNICIMAHVDHGKTSLADSLVASNGIISEKYAGSMRYMDTQAEEQLRGITMKSSSISLLHYFNNEEYLINLIDSPGHVDFSSEVSTAVRLCDGAIIVVDVVEGVCAQTKVVLRQAWMENIRPVLLLNKIDRLIVEMKLQPLDAYIRMTQIIEQVNAQVGELFAMEVMSKNESNVDRSSGLLEADDSNLYFAPERGNVVFASAVDGWGFTIPDFARILAPQINFSEEELQLCLWGDYYLESKAKSKSIAKGAQEKAKTPLFVQLVLNSLWNVYDSFIRKDQLRIGKILEKLNSKVHPRVLKDSNAKVPLKSVLTQWLPLSNAVLNMVCVKLPSPLEMSDARAEKLMCSKSKTFDSLPEATQDLKKSFLACSSAQEAPVIAFISKMIRVDRDRLFRTITRRPPTADDIAQRRLAIRQRHAELMQQQQQQQQQQEEEEEMEEVKSESIVEARKVEEEQVVEKEESYVFVAFARLFSGQLRKGQQLYVLGPKYDPSSCSSDLIDETLTLKELKDGQHVTRATVGDLYMMMAQKLELVDSVSAGAVVGIGGLQDHIVKSATLSSTLHCPPFCEMTQMAVPIVRVAVEPSKHSEMNSLLMGLKLLNQADPCVQVVIQESGEHVLITAGEIHLQRCLQDLRENYAKIEINVSQPIVPFRETLVWPLSCGQVPAADLVPVQTENKNFSAQIQAVSLPEEVTSLLEKNVDVIKALRLQQSTTTSRTLEAAMADLQLKETSPRADQLRGDLRIAFQNAGQQWNGLADQILCLGPRGSGPNILVNRSSVALPSLWDAGKPVAVDHSAGAGGGGGLAYLASLVNGFDSATRAGPLCEEPLMGVCYIIEECSIADADNGQGGSQPNATFLGKVLSEFKKGCQQAFQNRPQRLMAAMYNCSIQVSGEALGKIYGVLARRQGRILDGDLEEEGSASFSVTAVLPVVESFDLANEIRKQTSGEASLQLTFSHWEVIDTDPFWVPTTEEELELYGDKGDSVNRAQVYMNQVRRRKGLSVLEKVVEFATKQRTLSRKV